MTNEELIAIRERCKATTPGPWDFIEGAPRTGAGAAVRGAGNRTVAGGAISKTDGTFIAKSYRDVPALLDEVERLQCELAESKCAN